MMLGEIWLQIKGFIQEIKLYYSHTNKNLVNTQ